jgi:hypothetical protein
MTLLNSHYTFDEFEKAFPLAEMITHTNGNSIIRFNRIWSYNNKVLMCISEPHERDVEKDIDAHTKHIWVMFMKQPELGNYWNLYSSGTSEDVIKCTEHHFNPPIPVSTINPKDAALDLIEVNIRAALEETNFEAIKADLVKLLDSKKAKTNPVRMEEIKNKIENLKPVLIEDVLKKSACSYIYYSKNGWHAYYPEPSVLHSFHINNNKDVDQKYLDFLLGDKFKEMRVEWFKTGIIPGE